MAELTARDRLIFALDVANRHEAEDLAKRLAGHVGVFKVGLELYSAEGPGMVHALTKLGAPVFLDLKLHDIPTTVERAAVVASRNGVKFLTVHASGGPRMLQAACRGAREGAGTGKEAAKILAVTVLTSMDADDMEAVGLSGSARSAATRLATLADRAGCYGVISSAREAAAIRRACREGFAVVTPGIRPAGADTDDQARNETPAGAIVHGAEYLVVGRPIRDAADPVKAANDIVSEIEQGLAERAARGGPVDEEQEFTPVEPRELTPRPDKRPPTTPKKK